jgi:hypothetical protein
LGKAIYCASGRSSLRAATGTQVFDRIDQMAQVATKSIKFPQHECVAGLDRL